MFFVKNLINKFKIIKNPKKKNGIFLVPLMIKSAHYYRIAINFMKKLTFSLPQKKKKFKKRRNAEYKIIYIRWQCAVFTINGNKKIPFLKKCVNISLFLKKSNIHIHNLHFLK